MALSGPDTAKASRSPTAKNGRIGHTRSSGRLTIEPAFQDRIASKASGLVSSSAEPAPPSTAPTQTPARTIITGDWPRRVEPRASTISVTISAPANANHR